MTGDNGPSEIPAVSTEEIGIALALFRAAVLHETAEKAAILLAAGAILPLSDRGIRMASLEADALQRGIGAIRIHREANDTTHPAVQRVLCFLQLLREQNQKPHPLWDDIVMYHNQFFPITNAIAWCPAHRDKAFDVVLFIKIASHMANDVIGFN